MKARLCLVTSLLLLAGPALAQEPLEKTGTEPATTSDQAAPAPTPGMAAEPLDKVGSEPSTTTGQATQPAPANGMANEPLEKAGTEPSTNPGEAAPAPQAAAPTAAPAEVVITDLTLADDNKKVVKPWGVPVDQIAQMDVFDAKGKKIGQVDAVLQDKKGDIKGVAVGYGGFLGFGAKGAIVTLDQMKLKDGALVTELSEDQLPQQPEWPKKK